MVAKLREKVAKDWPVGWLEKVPLWKVVSGSSSWNVKSGIQKNITQLQQGHK